MSRLLALAQTECMGTHRPQKKTWLSQKPQLNDHLLQGGQSAEAQAKGDGHRRMPNEWVRLAPGSGSQALGNLLAPRLGLQLSVSAPGLPGHGGESYGL